MNSFFGIPLALTKEGRAQVRTITDAVERGSINAITFHEIITGQSPYRVIDGVAILAVHGIIAYRSHWIIECLGGTSLQSLGRDFIKARDDESVKAMILDIDSPGGDVSNLSNVSDIIYSARGIKPIHAVINPLGYSGAYWIASAAHKVHMASSTAGTGDIGIVIEHRDYSKQGKMRGVVTTEVYSGKYKRIASNHKPLTDEGRKYLQDRVDFPYSVFVDEVARNRNVSVRAVLDYMADGRTFIGQQAVDAGLSDGIASLDTLIERLAKGEKIEGQRFSMGQVKIQLRKEVTKVTVDEVKHNHRSTYDEIFAAGVEEGKRQVQGQGKLGTMSFTEDGTLAVEALKMWKTDPTIRMKYTTAADLHSALVEAKDQEKNPNSIVADAKKRAGLLVSADDNESLLVEDARRRSQQK